MPSAKKPAPAGKRPAAKRSPRPAVKKESRPRTASAAASPAAAATAPPSATPAAEAAPHKARRKATGPVLTIEQFGSGIGCIVRHKRTLKALGLRRPRHRVVRPDNAAVRGMVKSIQHLARIVEGA
jgi:large subunit ribosomal protein L30